jgi:hypothetical protein
MTSVTYEVDGATGQVAASVRDSQGLLETPVAWMFAAILLTFVIARLVTRYIRHRSNRPRPGAGQNGRGSLIGDISLGGIHIHHQVFGILIMVFAGLILVSAAPERGALCAVGALFGVGVGLVFDEFALWLHLKDVYWADEGRQSIDAIFCVLVITGLMIGGADLVTGDPGTGSWWGSIITLLFILALSVICMLKGKLITGVIGVLIQPVAIVGAIRLAKPGSWWDRHRYASKPKKRARARHRFDGRYEQRWNRVRDFIAGAPTMLGGRVEPAFVQPELPWPAPDDHLRRCATRSVSASSALARGPSAGAEATD